MSTFTSRSIDLVFPGEAATPEGWYVSHWDAGQSRILAWSPDNVRLTAEGAVELVLSAAPKGSARPYRGGEVQSIESATTGTWSWTVQAPRMVDGAVFGMFAYRADHFADPWIEFDFEFVGADTTQVRLNIHMETATGEHVTLEQAAGGPVIVDLGFDASQGVHGYDIVVTGTEAIFLVDGAVVGRFGAADMPYGTWTTGMMKGFTNLWCVDPSLEGWAGAWAYPGEPLVATAWAMDVQPGEMGELGTAAAVTGIEGTNGDDDLTGTDGDDLIQGHGGHDRLSGRLGNDRLAGGEGDDTLLLDAGDDRLEGGAGTDWLQVGGSAAATVDLALASAQATGYGTDTILGIENAAGGSGDDRLYGTAGSNALLGGAGADILHGRAGADRIVGGAGQDSLFGGAEADLFVFVALGDSLVGKRRDVIHDFATRLDRIDLTGLDAQAGLAGDQALAFAGTTAAAHSVWYAKGRSDIVLRADVTGDRTADFEIRLAGATSLLADDLLL